GRQPEKITKLKFFVTAQKKGWIWQHPGLSEENLKGYIYQRSRELNLNLPPAALESIALSCPCEAGAVEQELNKLALFYEAKGNLAELENQNVRGGEFNVFELIPCLERGDLASVYKHLQGQRDLEKIFFTLLVVLEREYRLLWQLKQGLSKVCSPWEAQKKRGRAQALPNYVLAKAQALIVTAEFRVKQGLADPKDALNAFLIELSELFLSYQKSTPRRRLN
ncbi:MAG: hypothetical protein IJS50_05570, partial [Desulfovibrio sp.]|nr:hypothetical protein [Desulfovibrio sp.]